MAQNGPQRNSEAKFTSGSQRGGGTGGSGAIIQVLDHQLEQL